MRRLDAKKIEKEKKREGKGSEIEKKRDRETWASTENERQRISNAMFPDTAKREKKNY